MSYLGIFLVEILKSIVIFEKSSLKFVQFQTFPKNQKCLNLKPKMPYLGIFGVNFENDYCHICNQHPQICQIHPQICQIPKFCKNRKLHKIATKYALSEYFFW